MNEAPINTANAIRPRRSSLGGRRRTRSEVPETTLNFEAIGIIES